MHVGSIKGQRGAHPEVGVGHREVAAGDVQSGLWRKRSQADVAAEEVNRRTVDGPLGVAGGALRAGKPREPHRALRADRSNRTDRSLRPLGAGRADGALQALGPLRPDGPHRVPSRRRRREGLAAPRCRPARTSRREPRATVDAGEDLRVDRDFKPALVTHEHAGAEVQFDLDQPVDDGHGRQELRGTKRRSASRHVEQVEGEIRHAGVGHAVLLEQPLVGERVAHLRVGTVVVVARHRTRKADVQICVRRVMGALQVQGSRSGAGSPGGQQVQQIGDVHDVVPLTSSGQPAHAPQAASRSSRSLTPTSPSSS